MPKEYNGHHCWNCWNVALWIDNNEPTYRFAQDCLSKSRPDGKPVTANLAALRFAASGMTRTPDGARYTHAALRRYFQSAIEEREAYDNMPPEDQGGQNAMRGGGAE